jgi:hypothetical protein
MTFKGAHATGRTCITAAPECSAPQLCYESNGEAYMTLVDPPKASTASLAGDCGFWADYYHSGGKVTDLFAM